MTNLYCQQIMKKIIRTGFSLIMKKENSWTGDLNRLYKLFLKHYPTKKIIITEAFNLIENPISDKEMIIEFLNEFNWMILDIKKIKSIK